MTFEWNDVDEERTVFGIPTVLALKEREALVRDLTTAWRVLYGQTPGKLIDDIAQCRKFFDPLARGHKLRERLSEVPELPTGVVSRLGKYGEPLVVNAGSGTILVGVEARVVIALLEDLKADTEFAVISHQSISWAEHVALETYRSWSRARLDQVINLRAGAGSEVMQAVAVGLVLALLVNRSDVPERAVVQWDNESSDGRDVDLSIHAGAERFAAAIAAGRGRSAGQQRLKGGYWLTEARRRLAHRLVLLPDSETGGVRVYIPTRYRDEVIDFLAADLARRTNLTSAKLESGFDGLVAEFRASSRALAYRSMVFERAPETYELKKLLMSRFGDAKLGDERGSGSSEQQSIATHQY